MVPPAPADEDDDLEDTLDIDRRSRADDRRRAHRSRRPGTRTEPVRRWRTSSAEGPEEPWDDVVDDERPKGRSGKPPVFWRARDSLYFEPLVALAIIVVLLVSLFAYTSNWPPVYVVESNSMQHGSGDHLGVLNAGDIVLAQKVPAGSVVTWVDSLRTGFSTYGLGGDVILYYPNGTTSLTPIIHRAIIYLQIDLHNNTWNATGLSGLTCGPTAPHVYYTPGTAAGCGTTYLSNVLYLYNVGNGRTVTVNFATENAFLGGHSGYLTLGDNNSYPDQLPPSGVLYPLSTLVAPGWVIGVARGLIPWFGALKLLLDGNSGKVPAQSWEFLGLTIAGIIFAAAGLHFLLRREREPRRRRREEAIEDEVDADEAPPPRPVRSGAAVKPWKPAAETASGPDPPVAAKSPRRLSYEERRRAHFTSSHEKTPGRRRTSSRDESDTDDEDT